jgi:hypothetical protein
MILGFTLINDFFENIIDTIYTPSQKSHKNNLVRGNRIFINIDPVRIRAFFY